MEKAIIFLVSVLVFSTAYAGNHIVGGPSGWTINFNYTNWASVHNFTTGDTLVFTYGAGHAVDEVTEADYVNCSTGNTPISSNRTSPTVITLDTPGTRYFICPIPNHCALGQRLAVKVTKGPAGNASTPSGTPISPRLPPYVVAPPPPPPSAAANLAGGNCLMAGLMSIGLMAVVGLVG
ncbi:hypothetical protein OROHE_002572 [Orobanche hederae]